MRGLRMPSPAMIVALIALACSLAGGAYALVKLPVNSVKSKQIARNAVKPPEIAANAVRSSEIAPNAAKGIDVAEATLEGIDAAALGGVAPSGYAQVFSGSSSLDPPDLSVPLFTVPALGAAVIPDNSIASGGGIRIRNDRPSGTLEVADVADPDGGAVIDPGEIEPPGATNTFFDNEEMPIVVTSAAEPGVALTILCGTGVVGEHCIGLLAGA